MGEQVFINQAFTNAINTYISMKQSNENPVFSTFPVMVIRTLIMIYGELDIINPFRTNNENRMGGFDENVTKFGFSYKSLQDFKESFQKYNQISTTNQRNPYFIKVEKYLIDMFFCRKKSLANSVDQTEEFKKYLYLSTNSNQIMQEELYKNTPDIQELDLYFQSKLFESNHDFQFLPYKKNTLIPEAYTSLGYTLDTIAQYDESTLEQLNNQILAFFKIDPNDPNKMNRLKEAIAYAQRHKNFLTSGNGYVDMLLLLSIIATVMMTLFAITVRVLG